MNTMTMNTIRVAVVVLTAASLPAEPVADWNAAKALTTGIQIQVEATSRKLNGQLQSVSDDMIVVRSGAGEETLMRPEVTRIAVKTASHRRRNAMIGLGLGAGAGLAVASIPVSCNICFVPSRNEVRAILIPVSGIAGAIVGVALPTGRWRDIYRSPVQHASAGAKVP
jgi:hypothetical protein